MKSIEEIKRGLLLANAETLDQLLGDFDVDQFDKFGNTLLHYFIKNTSAIHIDYQTFIDHLLQRGFCIDAMIDRGVCKGSPLHLAVSMNSPDIAKYLIAKGADVNLRDKYGKTPLLIAVLRHKPNHDGTMISLLLDNGADCKAITPSGKSLIDFVHSLENTDVGKYFE